MNDIHVSGHAYEEELKLMLTLVQPEYFMPVHGEYRHQFKHAQIAKAIGVNSKNIVIPNIGESFGVTSKGIRKHSNVQAGNMYVDGVVLEDGQSLVNDRLSLAEYGMLVVLAAVDLERGVIVGDVDVVARGFNLTEDVEKAIRLAVVEGVNGADLDKADIDEYARYVKKSVRKLFYRERQFPIIIPVIVKD